MTQKSTFIFNKEVRIVLTEKIDKKVILFGNNEETNDTYEILSFLSKETKVKYGLSVPEPPINENYLYVWNIFKSKEDLLKSL